MHDSYTSVASIPYHSNSIQASIGSMLVTLSAWVKMLDYELIASITAIITLVYIIFAFTMAIERRLKQSRFVSSKELGEFKRWKKERLLEELNNDKDTE